MGKFLDTQYTNTINSLIGGFKERLNNNYYMWNEKNTTITTYYNIDIEKSTLDESTKLQYSTIGDMSPIYFNKILNFLIYGLESIQLALNNGEFGVESSDISGEGVILPNTIIPYVGDYFTVDHIKEKLLFKIIDVTPDTLENGANFYKIGYIVSNISDKELIENNLSETFNMIINNIGTSSKSIVVSEKYTLVENVELIISNMRTFYKNLFYSDRVQTFIFLHNDAHFYDPNMIEFLTRTKILTEKNKYIFIDHQTIPKLSFYIDYEKTLFNILEKKNINNILNAKICGYGEYIESKTNIFSTRLEDYFEIIYKETVLLTTNPQFNYNINLFDSDLLHHIKDNILYDNDILYNILIKYFNNEILLKTDIDNIESIDYENNIKLFYTLPCVIYCLEYYIKSLMS